MRRTEYHTLITLSLLIYLIRTNSTKRANLVIRAIEKSNAESQLVNWEKQDRKDHPALRTNRSTQLTKNKNIKSDRQVVRVDRTKTTNQERSDNSINKKYKEGKCFAQYGCDTQVLTDVRAYQGQQLKRSFDGGDKLHKLTQGRINSKGKCEGNNNNQRQDNQGGSKDSFKPFRPIPLP